MDKKNNLPSQSNLVMIIAEENNTLRTLFDNKVADENGIIHVSAQEFQIMNFRSRFNPDLRYYKVNCEAYKRYGYTADELFEEIEEKYIASGYQQLHELFTFIERI